ncbi:MAG: metallophosphoesterase [candidate division KSB1 bacterium]|nr:metallophosphoesterase [candidate division KSB1 bacterium]MDZ7367077.1 metallophosphoesterase [candidate division KSB1 bacterium]MDZ7405055.1 metallophosphoesterase [candidate division KSB1 bacterium]
MTRPGWLTDIHLEFLQPKKLPAFADHVAEAMPGMVLIGGNTGIASNFALFLQIQQAHLECPIYFVLGNHDFYHGSMAQVRALAAQLTKSEPWRRWLSMQGVVQITKSTGRN